MVAATFGRKPQTWRKRGGVGPRRRGKPLSTANPKRTQPATTTPSILLPTSPAQEPSVEWPGTEIRAAKNRFPYSPLSQYNIGLDSTERNVLINRRAACGIIHAPVMHSRGRFSNSQTACEGISHLCIAHGTSEAWVLRITVHFNRLIVSTAASSKCFEPQGYAF